MKLETSETVDLLLHGYSLGSRYDGASAVALAILAIFLPTLLTIGIIILMYSQRARLSVPRKDGPPGVSAQDTATIRELLRGSESTDPYTTSSARESTGDTTLSHRRNSTRVPYTKQGQKIAVNTALPPFDTQDEREEA